MIKSPKTLDFQGYTPAHPWLEKILAKNEGKRFTGGKKPTLASLGGVEKSEPWPKAVAVAEGGEDDESDASFNNKEDD